MGRKLSILAVFALALLLAQPLLAGVYPGQLGVNLGGVEERGRGGTFVDVMKANYRWQTAGGVDLTPADVDAQGWPKVDARHIWDYRPVAEWENAIDDPEAYRIDMSGTYKCSFKGQATLSADGSVGVTLQNQVYDSGTNTTTFDFIVAGPPGAHHGLWILAFTNTKRTPTSPTGSGITELKMIRPGYPAGTTQLLSNEFLACLNSANFGAIRFMTFTCSNDEQVTYPETTTWAERKLTTDASQAPIFLNGKWEGGAWEYVAEIGNTAAKDIWVNVPVSATADYVTQLATLLKNTVNTQRNIYVESSNEVWNGIFPQCPWNQAQAAALGIDEHQNHARRTVELSNIFASVFGSSAINGRIRVVLCSHAPMLKWWVEPMLQYINTTYGAPKNYIYSLGRQTYFGGAGATGGTGTRRYTVTQILDGCHSDITAQIDEPPGSTNEAGRLQWVQKAAAWQIAGGASSYEGGPDFGGGSTTNIGNRITANRVERMKTEMKYNYDDAFFALGAKLAMQFTLTSGYHRYGCWGLTDEVNNPDRNYKFQAARDLLGQGGPTPTKMHVDSITCSKVRSKSVWKGRAVVVIKDDLGGLVSNATVTGAFTGTYNETKSGTTDANGSVTLTTTGTAPAPVSFTFCVTNVTHATLTYDPGANVETCDSYSD